MVDKSTWVVVGMLGVRPLAGAVRCSRRLKSPFR
eukprot:SAG31_NODE_30706_length_377_cov_0.744604_1_plen_33_part_10